MTETVEATQDVLTAPPKAEPAKTEQEVLVTEQEVMFSTAAAAPAQVNPITSRLIGALHSLAEAFRPPPPKPVYARRAAYIERSCMSREMDRL